MEIVCFTGRSRRAKRALIATLYDDATPRLGLSVDDLEVVILETARTGESGGSRAMSWR